MALYLLYETAAGYGLFEALDFDEASVEQEQIQQSIESYATFSKILKMKAFHPFTSAEMALNNMKAIVKSEITPELTDFLETNLASKGKKKKVALAVQDKILSGLISEQLGISGKVGNVYQELFRGIRQHFPKFLKKNDFKQADMDQAAIGLCHAFSRNKVSMDIARQDKHIIQTISLLEQLDKNLNQFVMRIKEWYSWHFPELVKEVGDNQTYVKLILHIKNKADLTEEQIPEIEEITKDATTAQKVYELAKSSMGQDFAELDQNTLMAFCERVTKGYDYRNELQKYLKDRMMSVAPSLTSFIGESVGAKLICQAGSLMNLAKYPASTVQILGAEKALFRALKTKGNTPKYGTLFHSNYISKAQAKDKGKISRYVANKCSLAARIDQFAVMPTTKFGEKMKEQVEARLKFLVDGTSTEKNVDVMKEVLDELKAEGLYVETEDGGKKKKKKKKAKKEEEVEDEEVEEVKPKKKKVKN